MLITLLILLIVLMLWIFGPREPAELKTSFDESILGSDLDCYLRNTEAELPDIVAGTQKRIVWHGARNESTPISIVYLHGFSANSEEIRPAPEQLAQLLGANLYYSRLTGHGRTGAAMAEATVADWMRDTSEALAIAKRIGDNVIILSTSTGGTLTAAAACDPFLSKKVAGMVFISPNFGVNNPAALLLTWPFARIWIPLLFGRERHIEPLNPQHAKFWTNIYPTVAALPMAALVQKVVSNNFTDVKVPALFIMSEKDQVVRPEMIEKISERWGGKKEVFKILPGCRDDTKAHVLAGDILSPGLTDKVVEKMFEWIKKL